jgi:hypothetical protein
MLQQIRFLSVFVLLISVGFLVSSCDNLKFTGGGTIPSNNRVEGDKANFGGIINACECEEFGYGIEDIGGDGFCVHSNIVYHDLYAYNYPGLRLKAKVLKVEDCRIDDIASFDLDGDWRETCGYPEKYRSSCCTCAELHNQCKDRFDECPEFALAAKFAYRSQNPKDYPNCKSGWLLKQQGIFCAVDNGEGYPGGNAEEPDFVAIKILSGPYTKKGPYTNCGPVSGNVQEHECEYYDPYLESAP